MENIELVTEQLGAQREGRDHNLALFVSAPRQDNSQVCSNVAYTFAKQAISQFPSETRAFLHILL